MIHSSGELTITVAAADSPARLDQYLVPRLEWSRARLQKLLKAGLVRVNGRLLPASYKVRPGDVIAVSPPVPEPSHLAAEPLDLNIIFEDRDLLVVAKPPDLVVHPGTGHRSGTLLNALLYHCPELAEIGEVSRPGLVHRLDKDTSGLLVVAKTAMAHGSLVRQFQDREVAKTYLALVWEVLPTPEGEIEHEVGRHPTARHKMSVHARRGREALTFWRVVREFSGFFSLLELTPKTGRTHQLRVHLAALNHPVLGDATYGGGVARLAGNPARAALKTLVRRQLLHAWRLALIHPRTNERLSWEASPPPDFAAVLAELEKI